MAEEKQPLTLEDIKKNTNLMGTIARYASDRYGKNYFDPDEALRRFPVRVPWYPEQYL
jgi:hypothetical protein